MDWRTWLRDRPAVEIGLAIGLGLAVFGCAGANDPENPENDGNPTNRPPAPASGAPLTPAPPAAFVQTAEELERRAEEAEKKIDPLRRDVESDPSNARKQHALGRALYAANFTEQGIVHLERAVELNPSIRTLLDLAASYAGAARLDDAERTYERLLRSSPGFSLALYNLGKLAYRRGEFGEAAGYFSRALEKEPGFLLARLRLGDSLNALGRLQDAYRTYEQALGLEPNTPQEASGYISPGETAQAARTRSPEGVAGVLIGPRRQSTRALIRWVRQRRQGRREGEACEFGECCPRQLHYGRLRGSGVRHLPLRSALRGPHRVRLIPLSVPLDPGSSPGRWLGHLGIRS